MLQLLFSAVHVYISANIYLSWSPSHNKGTHVGLPSYPSANTYGEIWKGWGAKERGREKERVSRLGWLPVLWRFNDSATCWAWVHCFEHTQHSAFAQKPPPPGSDSKQIQLVSMPLLLNLRLLLNNKLWIFILRLNLSKTILLWADGGCRKMAQAVKLKKTSLTYFPLPQSVSCHGEAVGRVTYYSWSALAWLALTAYLWHSSSTTLHHNKQLL